MLNDALLQDYFPERDILSLKVEPKAETFLNGKFLRISKPVTLSPKSPKIAAEDRRKNNPGGPLWGRAHQLSLKPLEPQAVASAYLPPPSPPPYYDGSSDRAPRLQCLTPCVRRDAAQGYALREVALHRARLLICIPGLAAESTSYPGVVAKAGRADAFWPSPRTRRNCCLQ